MRTSVDIPEIDLRELMRNTGANSESEAVAIAVKQFNRSKELEEINRDLKGKLPDFMSNEELMRTRQGSKVPLQAANGDHDLHIWIEELRNLQAKSSTGKSGITVDQIIEEGRAEEP